MIRIRRREPSPKRLQQIGSVDYVCLTSGSESRSFLSAPISVSAEISDGLTCVSLDENHGRPLDGLYQEGGPFHISSVRMPTTAFGGFSVLSGPGTLPPGASTHNGFDGSDWRARYSGAFALSTGTWGDGWVGIQPSSREQGHPDVDPDDMSTLGPRAFARLRPKVAVAGVFQSVAEAKDVPTTIKTSMKGASEFWTWIAKAPDLMPKYRRAQALRDWRRLPGRASEHFINHQFGWVPLVKDLTDIADVALFFSDHVAEAKRNNGKPKQRTFREDVVEDESVIYTQTGNDTFTTPALGTAYVVPGSATYRIIRRSMTAVWYSGSFIQYYPEFDDSLMSGHPALQTAAQAVRLLGAEVNPVNVYKVVPWTWLIDWFVNVGDTLQVWQDMITDAVVCRYFYLMRHSYVQYVYQSSFQTYDGQTISLEWVAGREVKARHVGQSQFGFSLQPTSLSGKQQAILGALGMTLKDPISPRRGRGR